MKSVMSHDFSRIPRSEIRVSTFDRSHGVKTAFDSGYLVPIYLDEVLPGDTYKVNASMLAKMLSPMVSAPMDNIFLETQWFYCPSRLLYNNFTRLMGERKNPKDSIDYLIPTLNSGDSGFTVGSLADYLGIPINVPNLEVSALPFRMYAKVWDEWYRAEQLQDCIINEYEDLGDGNPNNIDWNKLLRRGKRHDYFTSALPSPQLGAGVELPIGDTAPVIGVGTLGLTDGTRDAVIVNSAGSSDLQYVPCFGSDAQLGTSVGTSSTLQTMRAATNNTFGVHPDADKSGLRADLSAATSVTINSLRQAIQLQKMLEKDNRGGTRYVELIRTHFNTICPDARLQRSEYLGGSSQLINIHQQFQESATDSVTPQGNRIGTAQAYDRCLWSKSFSEHGYILGLVNVRVDLNYQQGLNRLWSRKGRYDFYWPTLAHLGEQAVLNKEIYAQGSEVLDANGKVVDDQPFGYQERYAEYRYHPSIITGKLRSTAPTPLDVWHLAQHFESLPMLSADWIEDNPPIKRVLAVQDEPEFIFDAYIDCKTTRAMPVYSVPGLVDHF